MNPKEIKGLAKVLRQLRNKHNYSQATAGEIAGVSRATYAAYEENRASPGFDSLRRLRIGYGFKSIEEMIGLNEPSGKHNKVLQGYLRASKESKRIVDYILKLK